MDVDLRAAQFPIRAMVILSLILPGTVFAAAPETKAAQKAPPGAVKTPPPGTAPSDKGFSFKDTAGEHLDIYLDGRAIARYMYANDT